MVRISPTLNTHARCIDSRSEIHHPAIDTYYQALSAEAKTQLGSSPYFVIYDELGQVEAAESDLYSATGAWDDPLSIVISTQARDDNALLSRMIDAPEDPKIYKYVRTAPPTLRMGTFSPPRRSKSSARKP